MPGSNAGTMRGLATPEIKQVRRELLAVVARTAAQPRAWGRRTPGRPATRHGRIACFLKHLQCPRLRGWLARIAATH
jgi:hypothetical protein